MDKAVFMGWDYKEDPLETLQKKLAQFGLHVYQSPSCEGSETFGFIVSNKPLTNAEFKEKDDFYLNSFD